jgi:hypothetical protein
MTEPDSHPECRLLPRAEDLLLGRDLLPEEEIAYAQAAALAAGVSYLHSIDSSLYEILEHVRASRNYLSGIKEQRRLRLLDDEPKPK